MWRHGWQRRRLGSPEVLDKATDSKKIYRLLQSDKYDVSYSIFIWWLSQFIILLHRFCYEMKSLFV